MSHFKGDLWTLTDGLNGSFRPSARFLQFDIAAATDGRLSLIAQIDTHHPQDTYLELSAVRATKAHAVAWLRDYLDVDHVIAYGDNLNDLPMFGAADEAYAVANAAPEVLARATEVIGSNVEDGVVRHLTAAWPSDAQMQPVEVVSPLKDGAWSAANDASVL